MKNLLSLRSCIAAFIVSIVSFFPISLKAQAQKQVGIIAAKVAEYKQAGNFKSETNLFSVVAAANNQDAINKLVKQFTLLDINPAADILNTKPDFINFTIPVQNGQKSIRLLLYKEAISPNGLNLLTSDGKSAISTENIVHYRGSIDNDETSVAAFSFSQDEIAGIIADAGGNYVVGKLNDYSGKHIIYNDRDLMAPAAFDCFTNTAIPVSATNYFKVAERTPTLTAKCVNWYWETDYDVFVNKGSVANVNTFMQAIFNQVATLYANDGMSITLKTLYVWTTTDPYTGPTTSDFLTQFGTNRTTFDGDLANLIGFKGNGGIAWINGICNSLARYKMAYSGIFSTYSVVPTFSWTVECIAHEEGHVIGSRHTHDCVWNGNGTKIDACGDSAGYSSGTCASPGLPSGGGTIMSYCHLTNAGINFNLGFGPQPKALLVSNITNASCLSTCAGCAVPSQPGDISGSTSVCINTSKVYSIIAVPGATGYTWTLPTGWTGTSTTNSITVTTGTASGTISVKANNSCGGSTARTLVVSSITIPATPASITGNISVCKSATETYSITAVSGATGYLWVLPTGWTGSSTSNSITVTTGTTAGTISVKATNSCGNSAAKTLLTSIKALPSTPGVITVSAGTAKVCPGDTRTYTVPLVTGRTYNWVVPAGVTIIDGQGTNSVNVYFNSLFISAGILSVTAVNNCGSSAVRKLTIYPNTAATPGLISVSGGDAKVCPGDTRTYTVPLVTGLTYTWKAPAGATISSGQGTNTIHIFYTENFIAQDTLKVTASNGCGTSAARILIIKRNLPATPVAITGLAAVCPGSTVRYSTAAIAGASSYIWTVPAGGSIQGNANDTIIYILWGSTAGSISVKASNTCGISLARSLAVKISCTARHAEKSSNLNSVLVYPNPAKDLITVKYYATEKAVYNISIKDLSGRTVLSETEHAVAGINTRQFNLSGMLKGNYLVIIESKDEKKTLKLQVE